MGATREVAVSEERYTPGEVWPDRPFDVVFWGDLEPIRYDDELTDEKPEAEQRNKGADPDSSTELRRKVAASQRGRWVEADPNDPTKAIFFGRPREPEDG